MNEYILMADIISSGRKNPKKTMEAFKLLVQNANQKFKKEILSPLTITLGDEFQGIPGSCKAAVEIIIYLEEELIRRSISFRLRYVLNYGEIETPINKKIAYGMLGEGLTSARESLSELKNDRESKFRFQNIPSVSSEIKNAFIIYQSIVDTWKEKDAGLITDFIAGMDYKEVALRQDKVPSLAWKRRKSLQINEYFAIKEVINYLSVNAK